MRIGFQIEFMRKFLAHWLVTLALTGLVFECADGTEMLPPEDTCQADPDNTQCSSTGFDLAQALG